MSRFRRYDDAEFAIIREEIARGGNWALRAAARLPWRSKYSIQTTASARGWTSRGKRSYGHATHAADHAQVPRTGPIDTSAYDRRHPPSTKAVSDRTPAFLADVFAKWRVS